MPKQLCLVVGLLVLIIGQAGGETAVANAPAPLPVRERDKPENKGKKPVLLIGGWMEIKVDPNAKRSILLIPVDDWPRKLEANDQSGGKDRTRSVIAAIAMSIAIGGAFFVRRSRQARMIVVSVVVSSALTSCAFVAFGHPAPANAPQEQPQNAAKEEPKGNAPAAQVESILPLEKGKFDLALNGKPHRLDIEATYSSDYVILILGGEDGTETVPVGEHADAPANSAPNGSRAAAPK